MTAARTIALVGFGNVAERGHLPAWLQRADFRIVAAADTDERRRVRVAELLPDVRVYERAEDLLREERPDVVDIATPPCWHAPLALPALAAGCHVLCEKPLATSPGDHEMLVRATRESGTTLFTVHNWKHSAQFAAVTALLSEGAIGRLVHIRLETVRASSAACVGASWRHDPDVAGGGILFDHGWHAFYLLASLAGRRPAQVSARVARERHDGVEHAADCRLDFGALSGEIHLTWAGAGRRTVWTLQGTDGSLVAEDGHLDLHRGGETQRLAFARSLSEGSHHPEWFGGVIEDFVREIDDRAARGRNLVEAALCFTLTRLAYESAACEGRSLPVPDVAGDR
jgi:predicted dehydrogenase